MFKANSKKRYSFWSEKAPGFHVTLMLWTSELLPLKPVVARGEAVSSVALAPPGSLDRKILALRVHAAGTLTELALNPKEIVQLPAAK
jgi:hypothetical protein